MAKRKPDGSEMKAAVIPPAPAAGPLNTRAATTGRFLILFRPKAVQDGIKAMKAASGIEVAAAGAGDMHAALADAGNGVILENLGVAVVNAPPEQMRAASAAGVGTRDSAILAMEPERYVFALWRPGGIRTFGSASGGAPGRALRPAGVGRLAGPAADYLLGYRDAVLQLTEQLLGGGAGRTAGGAATRIAEASAGFRDTDDATWGLQATQVLQSGFSGQGIRVAVLDTGIDLNHPDVLGRNITTQSFIDGEEVEDGNGHGTHTSGTATGPQTPQILPRYGIASNAQLFIGKVLSNAGSGADGGILAGIDWALQNQCAVVSMSLGAPVQPGESFSAIYEAAAQRALQAGTLIIAAAGNDSDRTQGVVMPVSRPANAPSIMAVAALESDLRVAFFSNAGVNPDGGQVDIAGPGVDVRSSLPLPQEYGTESGTSMATPHVAGIAALYAEADANARGQALWTRLVQTARRSDASSADVGAGLVQAPGNG